MHYFIISTIILILSCQWNEKKIITTLSFSQKNVSFDSTFKTIHIQVALCDNQFQGIVPVPIKIGNGQDPNNNLYWGCAFGIKSYFKKSQEWNLISKQVINDTILERIVFKHKLKNYYLIADAYNGKFIKECTIHFLNTVSGQDRDTIIREDKILGISSNAKLNVYIGHNGLMDFDLDESIKNEDKIKRDAIILACYGKKYFSPYILNANANPIIWSSGLMSPEAYTVHDAISGYLINESNSKIQMRAVKAYSKYQKCSEKAAKNLLLSGF